MFIDRFIAQRRDRWSRFQALLDRWDERRFRPLSAAELADLSRLYRQAAADLAVAQRDFPHDDVTAALNALVARGHQVVYVDRGVNWRRIARFFTHDYPRAFRAAGWHIFVAFLLMTAPGVLAYTAAINSEAARSTLVGAGAESMIKRAAETGKWTNITFETGASTSSFIMTNNIRVSFFAYAGGMLGGLATVYVLIANGLSLGGVAAGAQIGGAGGALWSFVAAHGPIELTMIFIAGGAGLLLGWGMLRPGLYRRRDAIVLYGRRSLSLIIGCVPMLVLAGLIEGYISPSDLPGWVKGVIALVDGSLLYAYLFLAGRTEPESAEANTHWQPPRLAA